MKKILTSLDFSGGGSIVNLPNPTNDNDAATKGYVDSAVEGLSWKDNARVAAQVNVTISSPGAQIDGITLSLNDRVLLRSQTTVSENGIYVWNGAAVAMTRAADADTFAKLEQAVISVDEGTDADTTFRQTEVNGTIDVDTVTFGSFGTAAPVASETTSGTIEIATQAEVNTGTDTTRAVTPSTLANASFIVKKFNSNVGDGAATSYAVNHNLNTKDVTVAVYRVAAPYDDVIVDIERTTVNQVTIKFAVAPAVDEYRVVVVG